MYSWEKSMREEKLKRNPRNPPHFPSVPSFSSSLLDQIYRSTDNGNEKFEELKFYREKIVKKQSNGGCGTKSKASNRIEDEVIAKSRTHCFTSMRAKPESGKLVKDSYYEGGEFYLFDDIPQCGKNREDLKNEDGLMKTKLRALKIYNSLKKIKEPISPGGRLTSFINSLFANGNAKVKKTEKNSSSKSTQASSTCSSASSYSRSCLSKGSMNSKEKSNNGVKRTVRFYPVSVIVDEDCRPCGHKSIYQDDTSMFGSITKGDLNLAVLEKTWKIEEAASYILKGYAKNDTMFRSKKAYKDEEDDDDDDLGSDSSSDLFELDHLTFIGNNKTRYCEELPVYETTHVDTNRAIANGLIR
ncbi:protein BIG GRAIN 1-like B [Actinidia eriantha]|uniref:protein BIG GRAIN 1-like B n=1 Tax=Actinidia eriantha TaxID=165200 RepID=UPI0025872C53|nr:protein BIG GRAIN 1-like B [Actinidia eriantha]